MGSGGGLGLAAVLAAAVLCGPGGVAGRVLSGECAGTGDGVRPERGRGAGGRIVSGVGAGIQRSQEQGAGRGRSGTEPTR